MRRLRVNLLVTALTGFALAGCEQKPPPPQSKPAEVAPPLVQVLPPPNIERATFLQALDAAASAYAAGRTDTPEALAGRRFVLRQPFGCAGPLPAMAERKPGQASLRWGPKQQSLELGLQPADWTKSPIVAGLSAWEAVEGFWLARPWLRTDACPASLPPATAGSDPVSAAPTPLTAPAPLAGPAPNADAPTPPTTALPLAPLTVGIAAVYPEGGSRLDRRDGRAFRHTVRGDATLQAPQDGYRLVLEGRFTTFPGGGAIECHAPGPDVRPVCIAAAEVDRIAFEDARGQVLSEWRRG